MPFSAQNITKTFSVEIQRFIKNCRLSTFQFVVWAPFCRISTFCRLSTFWKWASETFFIGFLPHKLFQICFFPLARRTSFLLCKWFDEVTAGKKTGRLSQLLYIDFRMLLQYVFRILQPETGYPFAECHFIRSLDISGKIGTVRMKYFGQSFYECSKHIFIGQVSPNRMMDFPK